MNIRNNILNYLYDRDYVIAIYEDYIYLFNFLYLNNFSDSKIEVKVKDKILKIIGKDLSIVKITKEELLIKGKIKTVEMESKDEKWDKNPF